MNAPLPAGQRLLLDDVSLDDKFALERGRVFMTGIQALIRLPMLQRQYDERAGLNTAGFITGYRGSPLGSVPDRREGAQIPGSQTGQIPSRHE